MANTITNDFMSLSNYEKLITTCDLLKSSQGFYGRLWDNLHSLDDEQINNINQLEEFKTCKDTLDVVMTLEG